MGPDNAKCRMLPVKSGWHYTVQAYSSKYKFCIFSFRIMNIFFILVSLLSLGYKHQVQTYSFKPTI